jgi:hypothetical protein
MIIVVTLTASQPSTGPFNISSNINYSTIINTSPIAKATLLAPGYTMEVPNGTTTIRIQSVSECSNYIDVVLTSSNDTTTSSTTSPPEPEACGITATADELVDPVNACASWSSYTPPSGAVYETYIQNIAVDFSASLVFGEFIDDYLSVVDVVSYTTMNFGGEYVFFPSNGEPSGFASSINPGTNIANDFNAGTDIVMPQGYTNPNPVNTLRFVGTLVTNLRTRKFDFGSYYDYYGSEDEGPNGTGPRGIGAESSADNCE